MGEVARIVTTTTGYTGSPGYTSMFFFGDPMSDSTVDSALNNVHDFWNAIKGEMPVNWNATLQTDVSVLDEATGALKRIVNGTDPGSVVSTAVYANYAGGTGACTTWGTAAVHGKRRLKGRTFIVPLHTTAFDSTGTIEAGALTILRTAADTLGAVANFGVYGRPRDADPLATPPVTALTGLWAGCTGASVRDHVAILRSRRD